MADPDRVEVRLMLPAATAEALQGALGSMKGTDTVRGFVVCNDQEAEWFLPALAQAVTEIAETRGARDATFVQIGLSVDVA